MAVLLFLGFSMVGKSDREAGVATASENPSTTNVADSPRDPCLHLNDLPTGDSGELQEEFELCLNKALQSNQIGVMTAQYSEARKFVDQGKFDTNTQKVMERKLADYKREIDTRTSLTFSQ